MPEVTRFAPSPTGWLHLGHAYAALFAHEAAKKTGGRLEVRLEDIDTSRVRPVYEGGIWEDLEWLGLKWEMPVRRQSEHFADYQQALKMLSGLDVLYPCFCTRKEIQEEIARAGNAPHGPDGPLYPGICRNRSPEERERLISQGATYALRLNVAKACAVAGSDLGWTDLTRGEQKAEPGLLGDVVLARKETPTSYHRCASRNHSGHPR